MIEAVRLPVGTILRATDNFVAAVSARGIRITANAGFPRHRIIRQPSTWRELSTYGDSTFDAACCLELGIGVYRRR